MKFDFDASPARAQTDSRKWHKYAGRDVLPLWVADMDFATPPAVTAALRARLEHPVFGYGFETEGLKSAALAYLRGHYGWQVEESWLVWLPGLVTGLNVAAAALGSEGDEILCCTPVYPPFLTSPTNQRRRTVAVPMTRNGPRWEMDFAALERAITPRTRAFFLCSPHNPVGRAFTREELTRLADFCVRHRLTLVSDEIHCDLILDDIAHIPTATVSAEIAARTITLTAPSKTYNVPGLGCSLAIIPDPQLRRDFARAATGIVPDPNILGLVACEAAFREGEPWRQQLLAYLRGNRDLIEQTVARGELPGVTMTHVEATYLAWLDVSALKLENAAAHFEQHGLGFSDGAPFGAAPNSHVRLNFGCTRATLAEALARMKRAVAAAR
jgi:cystathionine beta-lyase